MRSPRCDIITFTIMGQKFKIRAAAVDRERIDRVAAAVDEQIRGHIERRAMSETRAILMAAFEIGYELDELLPLADSSAEAKTTLSSTGEAMDRLLARLNNEIDAPAKEKKIAADPIKSPSHEGVQQELLVTESATPADSKAVKDASQEPKAKINLQEAQIVKDQN